MDKEIYERTIPLFIISFLGVWMILEYFISPLTFLSVYSDRIRQWATIIAAASWGLGISILTISHARKIYQRSEKPFWGYSVIFLVVMIFNVYYGVTEGTTGKTWRWFYDTITGPVGQALYSTTAFYITSAGYRVFRFRNLDAGVLLLSGMIVLMSVLPLFTGNFPFLVPMGNWINTVLSVAGFRAFTIGVALGTIGIGLRVFLHKHREVLG
jgi:hypothetical protein